MFDFQAIQRNTQQIVEIGVQAFETGHLCKYFWEKTKENQTKLNEIIPN